MKIQDIQLRLICDDADKLLSVILALPSNRHSGYLSLALFPTISFVIEESHNYLIARNLKKPSTPLFDKYKIAIKKSRALLKLFNDTDGGRSDLLKSFSLFQEKSSLWMNAGKSGIIGSISKPLQPDIGIYFLDEDPIYMTIIGFSATGRTKNEIESLSEGDFKDIPDQAKFFGEEIGHYFGALQGLMSLYEISLDYKSPTAIPLDLNITHNDFHSEKLYERIASEANLKDVNLAPALFFVLCQVNIAYALLPRLFPLASNLLLRIQFLTAYHAVSSLLEVQNDIDSELAGLLSSENILTAAPNIRKVRNVLAHCGLTEGKKFVTNAPEALNEVIQGLSGMSRIGLSEISKHQLQKISAWTYKKFSKGHLKNMRALFGDHT